MKKTILILGLAFLATSCSQIARGDVHPLLQQARAEKDTDKTIELYWKYMTEARGDSLYSTAAGEFADQLGENHRQAEIIRLGDLLAKLIPPPPEAMNTLASALAQADTALDKALVYSQLAISAQREKILLPPPPDKSPAAWKERQSSNLGYFLDTEGFVLLKQKEPKKALEILAQADSLADDPDLYLHLAQGFWQMHKPAEALDWAVKARYDLGSDENKDVKQVLTEAYTLSHGSPEGLEAYLSNRLGDLRKVEYARLMAEKMNVPAKPFNLLDLKGNSVNLANYKGKVVLVDFWATWCGPCKRELPLLQAAYPRWKEQGIELLAISTDKDAGKVAPFISKNNYTFPVLFNQNTSKDYDVSGIPTLFVVDQAGVIQYRHLGYRPDVVDILNLQLEELNKK